MTEQSLTGKVAIVTGGAGRIGSALVEALCNSGADVVIVDIDRERIARLGKRLSETGHEARILPAELDVSDPDACEEAIGRTRERFGPPDILINNAAVGMGAIRLDPMTELVAIHEITPAHWQRFIGVNLSGAFYMTRAAMPDMLEHGWGRIVNVTTSFYTMLRAGFAPYGPAKAGLEAMSAAHAEEFKETGVTVNVVVPGGPKDTPMVPPEASFERSELIPPRAMAAPILWLCSEEADVVTGKRYVAARWDPTLGPEQAAARAGAPIGWSELSGTVV